MPSSPRDAALKWTTLALCLLACTLAVIRVLDRPVPPKFAIPAPPEVQQLTAHQAPLFETRTVTTGATPQVHCSTAVALPDGRIRAFWFGGTIEGASDVSIWSSVFDSKSNTWSKEEEIITRKWTSKHLHRSVRKLGNPVVHRDKDDRLWLFYVTVSVGGWSGSSITLTQSTDHGESWSPPRRLITSPFFNFATLVRQPVITFKDGTIGLPVYQEFIGKFCELLRLDPDGNIVSRSRLTRGRRHIQALIHPQSDTKAIALMRDSLSGTHHIGEVRTEDGGQTWTSPVDLDLPNPDSAVGGLQLSDGRLLLAFNNSKTDRDNLSLAITDHHQTGWQPVSRFDLKSPATLSASRYGYPWLLRDDHDVLHLFYTADLTAIRHVRFNAAWLDDQLHTRPNP